MAFETIIIDDDPLICMIHQRLLTCSGIASSPLVFANGVRAIEYLLCHGKESGHYLILLDLNMPVLSGWNFLAEMNRLNFRNYHVVIVSSSVMTMDRVRANSIPAVVGYLEKPLTIEALNREVRPFIERHLREAE